MPKFQRALLIGAPIAVFVALLLFPLFNRTHKPCNCSQKPFNRGDLSNNLVCQEEKPEAAVDRSIDTKAFKGWIVEDNPWTFDDETDNAELTYVNLQLNPERYTGYKGPSAWKIWDAVYTENCPKYPSTELCPEKRILYKLISGLHSSISIHIAAEYLLDEATNTVFFCPSSAIMDCVGCEKCRLWGKLQVLGLGTALKILFSVNGQEKLGQSLHLQRNEVIALINLLNRLSESVKLVHQMGPSLVKMAGGQVPSVSKLTATL
nr:endoplasmic reticulum oxidoreductin-1-like [Ipomoea batatas]